MYAQIEVNVEELIESTGKHLIGNSFYVSISGKTYGVVKGKLSDRPSEFMHPLFNNKVIQSAVYFLHHWPDGKFYVGSSENVYVRAMSHRSDIRMKHHACKKLNELLDNSHLEHFDLIIIFTVTRDDAYAHEQLFLNKYKNDPRLLNWAEDVKAPMLGREHSPETKQLMSEIRKTSDKALAQFEQVHKNKQRRVSVYGVEYESITLAGQQSPYSESFIRRRLNLDYDPNIFYLSDNVSPVKGTTISEKHKQKLSTFRKTDPKAIAQLESIRHLQRKKIIFNGVEYESISEASRLTGVNEGLIRKWFGESGSIADDGTYILNRVRKEAKAVNVDGVVYASVREASEQLSISIDTIKNRIRSGKITYVE